MFSNNVGYIIKICVLLQNNIRILCFFLDMMFCLNSKVKKKRIWEKCCFDFVTIKNKTILFYVTKNKIDNEGAIISESKLFTKSVLQTIIDQLCREQNCGKNIIQLNINLSSIMNCFAAVFIYCYFKACCSNIMNFIKQI